MFLKASYTTTVLAALGLILALQIQLVHALPLQTSAAIKPTTQINHDAKPWLATRARQSPQTTNLLRNHEEDNTSSTVPLLVVPNDTFRIIRDLPQQLLRRASGVATNQTFLTAMFVVLIVVSVLIGVAIGSIAICGLDWKRYLSRSKPREYMEEKGLAKGLENTLLVETFEEEDGPETVNVRRESYDRGLVMPMRLALWSQGRGSENRVKRVTSATVEKKRKDYLPP
ncbi:predicted protein [Chaetomium globosum CBS 148.51]|uniref:Uncharacterized protein n=1 Tax=Chaetomium globosum (strain ATCC 6205 / CBS 148.51 / DSM 1962 / NBRC 6347 / NRRL 1970) TaxID=306901 RepID=Q2HEX2_CHAGB|nr:uncharacterized protein CHGG_01232 [Chaetomium globosum CBS 148.51]EAQ92997.1 predicted protein [Chaetomium globosum CBS 148.51]